MPLPAQDAQTRILTCQSTADFLAALPQLTGFTAHNSAFVVFFAGRRSHRAMRIDLPENDTPATVEPWLDFISEAVAFDHEQRGISAGGRSSGDAAPAIVFATDDTFASADGQLPRLRLAKRLERRLRREGVAPRELCCIAPDSWGSYLDPSGARHPLSDITNSDLADHPEPPDIGSLGALPPADPTRTSAVAARLAAISPYDFPSLEHPLPAGSRLGWISETVAVTRELRRTDRGLSPRMTARLLRSSAHPDRWFIMALGVLTRPGFPLELAREMPAGEFENLRIGPALALASAPAEPAGLGRGSIFQILACICPDFAERERLPALLNRLLIALSESPPELRPGLYAFSGWVWWLCGIQTVAEQHVQAALRIDPDHGVAHMVAELTRTSVLPGALSATPLALPSERLWTRYSGFDTAMGRH